MVFERLDHGVDPIERMMLGDRRYFTLARELERFAQILPCPDDGPLHRQAFDDHIEDRNRDGARRDSDKDTSAASTQHRDTLLIGLGRHRRDEYAMRPSRRADDPVDRKLLFRVDHKFGTKLPGERQLFIIDVDRNGFESHGARILECQMTDTADAGYDD